MRKLLRPILIFLAIVFLIEAWLWDRLEPIVARIVAIIPWIRFKTAVARWIDGLPPSGTLVVFIVPAGLSVLIKMIEYWLFANGDWAQAIATLIVAKFVVIGTTAFVFDVTRDKLLQLDWFRVLYDYVMWLRNWAHDLVEPIKHRIRLRMKILALRRAPRAYRLLRRIRRRMQAGQPAQ